MTPLDELRLVFMRTLKPRPGTDVRDLRRFTSGEWDSLAHMSLVVEVEEQFNVQLGLADIEQIKDFPSAQEVLVRLGVEFDRARTDHPARNSDHDVPRTAGGE